jgi:hypothetical protein
MDGLNTPIHIYHQFKEGKIMEPKFKVGDVVNLIDNPSMYYVVIESILIDNGIFRRYRYEVSNIRTDDTFVYDESGLEFQYHDTSWEYYLIEGTRNYNDLPDWRGELYNFYSAYTDYESRGDGGLDKGFVKDHWNDTIPVHFMRHIIEGHSVYGAIKEVTDGSCISDTSKKIREKLGIERDEFISLRKSIMNKINLKNLTDIDPKYRAKYNKNGEFTDEEKKFIAQAEKLHLDGGKPATHYKINMTNLQIMDAIKEAYKNAHRLGEKSLKQDKDLRTGELPQPMKGYRKYEGYSPKYDITIRFLYNFDMDLITTAYPKQ